MQGVHFRVRVSVFNQRFDSRLPCANSKPVLTLSKAAFFNLFVPGRGGRRDQRIVRLKAGVPLASHREERARNLSRRVGQSLQQKEKKKRKGKPDKIQ